MEKEEHFDKNLSYQMRNKTYSKRLIPTTEQIVKIGREYFDKGAYVLSNEMGISQTQIGSIVERLRRKGVKIPFRKTGGPPSYIEAIKQLKNNKTS